MLKEDYKIDIIGRQVYIGAEDTEPEQVALCTTGTYTERGEARFIAYKEYEEENPRVSHTTVLKIEPGKVTMMRPGSATRLILEEGQRNLCVYDTGYGTMSVGVFTSKLSHSLQQHGGKLTVRYTLDIDSNLSSCNELEVHVKPCRS